MKKLILYRHAKTEKAVGIMTDFQRKLTHRGIRDAESIGKKLRTEGPLPDKVISSDAVRAIESAELTCDAAGFQGEIQEASDLYLSSINVHIQLLHELGGGAETVMLVGHNPIMEDWATHLAEQNIRLKTAYAAVFCFHDLENWEDIEAVTRCPLDKLLTPH